MIKIDLNTWNRKDTFLFFKNFDYPKFSITVDVDVTQFYQVIKEKKFSFYFSMIHLIMTEINQFENFKYRIKGEDVYLYEKVHPSFTDLIDHTEQFKIVNTEYLDDVSSFIIKAKEKSQAQGSTFINLTDEIRQDLVYITTFPWAKFTQVTNAYHEPHKDSIPRLCFGKFEKINEKLMMPLSIEVHHGCMDGYHVGKFIEKLQKRLNTYTIPKI